MNYCIVLHCNNMSKDVICENCYPKCMKTGVEEVPLKKVFCTLNKFVQSEKNIRTIQWLLDCHYKFKLLPPENGYHKINNYRRAYIQCECDKFLPNHTLSFKPPSNPTP